MRICSVDGCQRKPICKGFCAPHYMRHKRHGNPHSGRTPDGEPLRHLNTMVMLYKGDGCLSWPYGKDRAGRAQIYINGRTRVLARVICERECGVSQPRMEAAHTCGNAWCINRAHIVWKTHAENEADKGAHGTRYAGPRHWNYRGGAKSGRGVI